MVDNGTLPNFQGYTGRRGVAARRRTLLAEQRRPDAEGACGDRPFHALCDNIHSGRAHAIERGRFGWALLSSAGSRGVHACYTQKGKAKGAGKGKGGRELESDSPSGKFKAFVRGNNLYVEEVEGKKERALTTDGSEAIFNGKNDWVYMEEVVGRGNRKHYWWSPKKDDDIAHDLIAFIRLDDTNVPKATLQDFTQFQPRQEIARYPNAGDTNPEVKFAIASASGEVNWADLGDYKEDILVTRVGWLPDGKTAWFSVQDRCQTWLDFCTLGPGRRQADEALPRNYQGVGQLSDGAYLAQGWLAAVPQRTDRMEAHIPLCERRQADRRRHQGRLGRPFNPGIR